MRHIFNKKKGDFCTNTLQTSMLIKGFFNTKCNKITDNV
jgi:hypothetical protein